MEIFDISTIMQCLGEKKKLQKFSFPFQSEFRKTISSFFLITYFTIKKKPSIN